MCKLFLSVLLCGVGSPAAKLEFPKDALFTSTSESVSGDKFHAPQPVLTTPSRITAAQSKLSCDYIL